jgi:hypothetical protein
MMALRRRVSFLSEAQSRPPMLLAPETARRFRQAQD